MPNGNPFTIEEAELALTLESSGISVWMGACANKLTLTDELTETPIQYHGVPQGKIKHVDESHVVEIENVWLLNTDAAMPMMPLLKRGTVHTLVIVWQDEDTGYFNKRTYYGVTWRSQRIGDNSMQNVVFRADRFIEESGMNGGDLNPSAVNQVIFVDGQNRLPLYNYNPITGEFVPVDASLIPAMGEIHKVSGNVLVDIGGMNALKATSAKTSVKELVAVGTTTDAATPRLEFWLDTRVATLTKDGRLVVGNATEDNPVADSQEFQFGYDGVNAPASPGFSSIGAFGLVAPIIGEDLP